MANNLAPDWNEELTERTSFNHSLLFGFPNKNDPGLSLELKISIGEFVAIKGETGIGKTTLLKSVGGLIAAEFSLEIDGKNLASSKNWRPRANLVSQNPYLRGETLFEMITGENSAAEVNMAQYSESLRISELANWAQQRPSSISNEHISGGERKQIALARAIYQEPEILLLDEVTAGMDTDLAERIIKNLLTCSRFKLILMATHDSILESEFSQIINL
jgi:ABC-type transport system involved in cytochrome bd biosynthesis fused ATPase/permease subunit